MVKPSLPTLVLGAASSLLASALSAPLQAQSQQLLGSPCGGNASAPPTIAVVPELQLGATSMLNSSGLRAPGLGFTVLGWSGTRWNAVTLPLPLDGYGAPGCSLQARPEASIRFSVAGSSSSYALAVPNIQSLAGRDFFGQTFFYDSSANAAALGSTPGLRMPVLAPSSGGQRRSSITQWGITWTFDQAYDVGQFCNGDWWVVGPVTIVDISPGCVVQSGRTINGAMINPGVNGNHGYDSTLYGQYASSPWIYRSTLNRALGVSTQSPLVVPPSSSLISVVSQMTPDPGGSLSQLATAAVLTVLSAPAPVGAFRPPYTGSDKTIRYNEAQLDWSALANLPLVQGVPQIESVAPLFERVWLDHCTDWLSRFLHPVQNMKDYGRDFSADIGSAALLVNMDFSLARKRDLVIRLTQLGIDWWANVQAGATWPGLGGQGSGRKFPILFAGRMLGDNAMLNVGQSHPSYYRGPGNTASVFSEDCQTFYVEETSPGVYNWGNGGYNSSHVGMPEWGNNHTTYINRDNVSWTADAYRTCCTANAWPGYVLAARVMGLRQAWNHPALFDYMDRYMVQERQGSWTRSWVGWHAPVWYQYRPQF